MKEFAYKRSIVNDLVKRVGEPRSFMQVLKGTRQTGKSTILRQLTQNIAIPYHFALAGIDKCSRDWLRAEWFKARQLVLEDNQAALLIIDEVQLVNQWSSVVKELWDEDTWNGTNLQVILCGSSSLLLERGLAEGLTGRFEVVNCPHWSYGECKSAFGYTLDDFLYYGGYPASAKLKSNEQRWLNYMNDSIIEPSISKDVVSLEEVRKPALMHRLFYLGCSYSAQEMSYRKILGQLDDAGNTTTIAHYLELLDKASLLCGLQKFSRKSLASRSSSPRLLAYDNSLMVATYGQYRNFLLTDSERRGHLAESAVGAYLLAQSKARGFDVYWWREGYNEVDYVLSRGDRIIAIEVKSGKIRSLGGLDAFLNQYPQAKAVVIGSAECPLEDFLLGEIDLF